jgi:hypothetical protein
LLRVTVASTAVWARGLLGGGVLVLFSGVVWRV